jgi:hypothetical protein
LGKDRGDERKSWPKSGNGSELDASKYLWRHGADC